MRDYLGNLQRRKTVREIVTKARKEYTGQIEQQNCLSWNHSHAACTFFLFEKL